LYTVTCFLIFYHEHAWLLFRNCKTGYIWSNIIMQQKPHFKKNNKSWVQQVLYSSTATLNTVNKVTHSVAYPKTPLSHVNSFASDILWNMFYNTQVINKLSRTPFVHLSGNLHKSVIVLFLKQWMIILFTNTRHSHN